MDRGYANPPSVQATLDRHSDLLVRYNAATLPVFGVHGERIDVQAEVRRTTRRGCAKGRKAYVRTPDGRMLAVRVCWMRLSKADAAKARARAKLDGADATEIEAAEYIVVLTTVPRAQLGHDSIIELYRARWQVELDFKRDKSIGQLDTLPSELPETIHSWLCAKVLLGLIARRLASQDVVVPPSGIAALILPQVANTSPRSGHGRRALVRHATGVEHPPQRASAHQAA